MNSEASPSPSLLAKYNDNAVSLAQKHCDKCTVECRACVVNFPPCRLLHTCGREELPELKKFVSQGDGPALEHADKKRPCKKRPVNPT